MPTITGTIPDRPGQEYPCVWCGTGTDLWMDTLGRPDLGSVPLHITCAAQVIRAFEAMKAGRALTDRQQQRLTAYAQRLLPAVTA